MNKKLLFGINLTFVMTIPIFFAISCKNNEASIEKINFESFLDKETNTEKIKAIITGNNLSVNKSDWEINEESINYLYKLSYNLWIFDEENSNNNTAIFIANSTDVKGKKFSFGIKGKVSYPHIEVVPGSANPNIIGELETNLDNSNNKKITLKIFGTNLPILKDKYEFIEKNSSSLFANDNLWTLKSNPTPTSTYVEFEADYEKVNNKTFVIKINGDETSVEKEFSIVTTITNTFSEITNSGDIQIRVVGNNLTWTISDYIFTCLEGNIENNSPLLNSSIIELDSNFNNSSTEVQFIIKKINSKNIVQTKGLYGKKFNVKLNDQSKTIDFTFGKYSAPTGVGKKIFNGISEGEEHVSETWTSLNDDQIMGSGLNWTITSSSPEYKSIAIRIFQGINDDDENNFFNQLSGQKGYDLSGSNTELIWKIKEGQDQSDSFGYWIDEHNKNGQLNIRNSNYLTKEGLKVVLIGTLKDLQTQESTTFELNIIFKLPS